MDEYYTLDKVKRDYASHLSEMPESYRRSRKYLNKLRKIKLDIEIKAVIDMYEARI